MRKRILTVLVALCMVIGLLPLAAFAAQLSDAQVAELKAKGYTDAQIEEIQKQIAGYESDEVMLVFEDTVIDQAESRLVLVVAPKATVTVDGAKLDTGIVVAPGATDAKVTLKAGADVNAVIVLDKAEVVVEKDAAANSVTVTAPEASVEVAGTVSTVAVAETAEKASVKVTETATVSAVEVAAPAAKTEITGTVSTVTVAETAAGTNVSVSGKGSVESMSTAAAGTTVNVGSGASVGTVSTTASNTTVNANGTVGTLNVGENATVETTGSGIQEVTGNQDAVTEKKDPVVEEPVDTHKSAPAIVKAPLGNKGEGDIVYAPDYKVTVTNNTENDKKFNVVITGNIPYHNSSAEGIGSDAFVGFAIPVKSKTDETEFDYKYYIIKTDSDGAIESIVYKGSNGNNGLGNYNDANMVDAGADADMLYDPFYVQEGGSLDAPEGGTVELIVIKNDTELDAEAVPSAEVNGTVGTDDATKAAAKAELYEKAEYILNILDQATHLDEGDTTVIQVADKATDEDGKTTVEVEVDPVSPSPAPTAPTITAPSTSVETEDAVDADKVEEVVKDALDLDAADEVTVSPEPVADPEITNAE